MARKRIITKPVQKAMNPSPLKRGVVARPNHPIASVPTSNSLAVRRKTIHVDSHPSSRGRSQQSKPSRLSDLLVAGAMQHAICKDAFVILEERGYYAQDRHYVWMTCAVAAMYSGGFGRQSVELPRHVIKKGFSKSQAGFRLGVKYGINPYKTSIHDPIGGQVGSIGKITEWLVDDKNWDYDGIIDWLRAEGR